jgi:NitT/TauT family transport system substrate-binding protein
MEAFVMLRMRKNWIVVAIALVFMASGCGPGCRKDVKKQVSRTRVNVGYIPIAECAHLYVALDQKYFESENLDVHLVAMAGGAEIIPRLENGNLDVGFTNVVSLMREDEKQTVADDFLISLGASSYEAGRNLNHALLVRADSPFHSIEDLKRRNNLKFAINTRNNIDELQLRRYLVDNGIDSTQWSPVTMPFAEMTSALDMRKVDAAAVVEPYIVPALTRGAQYRMLARQYQPEKGDTLVATYAVTRRWQKENPNTEEAFRRAMAAAARFMQANDPGTRTIIAKFTHVSESDAQSMGLPKFTDSINQESYKILSQQLVRFSFLTTPPRYEDILYTRTGR